MRYYQKILFFITCLLFSLSGIAQISISGKVSDAKTGEPLFGANVLLKKSGQGTSTDKAGFYHFAELPPGIYRIEVRFVGYEKQSKTVRLQNNSRIVHFKLEPASITTGEVIVQSQRNEREVKNIPMRVNVISLDEIKHNPVQNVDEMLDFVSGVHVSRPVGMFSTKSVVSMRGLSGDEQARTLVLLDNVPMNKADGGTVNWQLIDKDAIKKVEITKGPGGAMYGSNAMGGVIHFKTKQPHNPFDAKLNLEYGTYNTLSSKLYLSGKIDNEKDRNSFYWALSGFRRTSDGYMTEHEDFIEDEDSILTKTFLNEFDISGKIGLIINENHQIEMNVDYFDDKRGRGVKVFENEGAFDEHDTYHSRMKYSATWGKAHFNMNAFYRLEQFARVYEYMQDAEYKLYEVDSKRRDNGLMAFVTYPVFTHNSLTFGINVRQGNVDATDTYFTSSDIISNAGAMETYSAFLEDEVKFLQDKMTVKFGMRYNYAKFHDGMFLVEFPSYSVEYMTGFQDTIMENKFWDAFTPSFSVQYKFNEETRIFVSIAQGFRAPVLDDLCRTGKKRGTFKISNPGLNPEFLTNYEIGGDIGFGKNMTVSPSIYRSVGNDFMYYVSTGDSVNMGYRISPILQIRNISKVEIHGAEIDVRYQFGSKSVVFANYSYNHSQIKDYEMTNPEVDEDLEGKYLTDVPSHKFTGGISHLNRFVNVTLQAKYIGERWINDLNETDDEYLMTDKYEAYSVINGKVWQTFFDKKLHLGISVENILDKIYISKGLQRCPGRFITFEVTYKFSKQK